MTKTIGLIAGNGRLPVLIADEINRSGNNVAICALHGEADPSIESLAKAVEWAKVGELGRVLKFFKRENITEFLMAGKITKTNLFRGDIKPDLEMIKVLATRKNHSDDSLLGGIADYFESKGVRLLETTSYLGNEALPSPGILSKRKPSKEEFLDIEFGWNLAKEMGRLDIGQTVVVKKQAILAVEAIEGTDEAIKRGGALGNGGAVVVKVSKPRQDMRFDVPTVGLGTLESLIVSHASVLAVEAGKTIFMDRKKFIEEADRQKIAVVCR